MVELSESAAISLSVNMKPSSVSATLATPFSGLETSTVECHYEMEDDRAELKAEIHITDDGYELSGHWIWPQDYLLAEEMKLTFNAPHLDSAISVDLTSDLLAEVSILSIFFQDLSGLLEGGMN